MAEDPRPEGSGEPRGGAPVDRPEPALPRTERPDAPLYLASYLRRRARAAAPEADAAEADDGSATPLYLRRFRERRADPDAPDAPPPVWNGEPLEVTRAWADITRTKEIVAETPAAAFRVAAQVHIIRHGETQGYSTESGLTPWAAGRPTGAASTCPRASATASRSRSSAPTPTGPARRPSTSTGACSTASTCGAATPRWPSPGRWPSSATSRSPPPTACAT